jgi:type IX secretion system PorP/SprF family membrane protein
VLSKHSYKILITISGLLAASVCYAQDLHFSQFFNSPLLTNPANTGFIPDADYRIGANYRNQWSSVMNVPYKTMSIFGDGQLFRDRLENGWLGIGGVIISDEAGSGSLKSTKVYGSLAYHQMLANSSLLSMGFNVGWANKRIDGSKLKFPDQFDGKFFDNTLPTSVALSANNISYLDVQAGLNYAYFPQENMYLNAGYSIHHVNRPKETFFNDTTNNGRIAMRHIAFINSILKVNDRLIINPNILYHAGKII